MKKCLECGNEFSPKNKKGKFCSQSCKQKNYRKGINKILDSVKEGNKGILHQIKNAPQVIYDPSKGVTLKDVQDIVPTNDIKEQIKAIQLEKIPKERETTLGKKVWLQEQEKRILELEKQLK